MNNKALMNICLWGWIILCATSIFPYSYSYTDPYIVPKWIAAISFALCLSVYCTIRMLIGKSMYIDLPIMGISISVLSCVLAIYGVLQYFFILPSHSIYKVTGTFDNPAGFASCLCFCLPFTAFLIRHLNKYVRLIGWIIGSLIVTAVFLSYSRSGIISIFTIIILFLSERFIAKTYWKYIATILLIGLITSGCYWMKKNSADGRLLIWQCGLEMVSDAPWIGHGIGSFEAHYMDYQADFFKNHGLENRFAMLADNVKQPFNEYLGVLINYGIVGFSLLMSIIALLIYCYKVQPAPEKRIAIYIMISIAVFSCFSYPFTYPFTWIITLIVVIILTKDYLIQIRLNHTVKNIVYVVVMICAFWGMLRVCERVRMERNWNKASVLALCNSYDKAIPRYMSLIHKFEDNPYFLYNYAAILLDNKQYDESLQIALKCRRYWADYDLELIIAENYQHLGNIRLSEKYYTNAYMMCPSRFLPLYRLFHLYKENNDNEQMLNMAEIIINKPMKIESSTILMMKREMKRAIQ